MKRKITFETDASHNSVEREGSKKNRSFSNSKASPEGQKKYSDFIIECLKTGEYNLIKHDLEKYSSDNPRCKAQLLAANHYAAFEYIMNNADLNSLDFFLDTIPIKYIRYMLFHDNFIHFKSFLSREISIEEILYNKNIQVKRIKFLEKLFTIDQANLEDIIKSFPGVTERFQADFKTAKDNYIQSQKHHGTILGR